MGQRKEHEQRLPHMTWRMPDLLRVLTLLLCLCVPVLTNADTIYCADEDFTPAGNDGNSGATAALPKTDGWCRDPANVSAGDIRIYASGNYEGEDFIIDGMNGADGNLITHRCAGKHTCSFDRWAILNSSYLELINLKTDSDYWDSTKSYTNPRIRIRGSNDIYMTAVFIRGDRDMCAPGWLAFNGGAGDCRPTAYGRYQDVITFGDNSTAENSYNIAIRSSDTWGETRVLYSSHELLQIHDNKNGTLCEATEVNYYIGGTTTNPLIWYNEEHHGIAVKGGCNVLVEHVDFQKTGTGRGDLNQTEGYSVGPQSGGTHHGATFEHYTARFNTYSFAGTHSLDSDNSAVYEAGFFGDAPGANYGCFAHNSVWRPWASTAIIGEVNGTADDIVVLNVAIDEGSYGYEQDGAGVATSEYIGFAFGTGGSTEPANVYIDGIVYDVVSGLEGDKFLIDTTGVNTEYASTDCPSAELGGDTGIECGSNITYSNTVFFEDPANRDFTINTGDPASLTGTAIGVAKATNSGTGSTINVTANRAQCFFDDLGGIRASGDVLDINGDECTVTGVDYVNDQITCNETITWASGEDIFFKVDGAVHDDIGAIPAAGSGPGLPTPGPGRNLEPHL